MGRIQFHLLIFLVILAFGFVESSTMALPRCQPTTPDADGPFYRPGAPERNSVGQGYVLTGTVRSATDCSILPQAKIEIWMNGPDGRYGDDWRATIYADKKGRYRFESHQPVAYGSRPPHIHIIVNADGFAELITQHYSKQDEVNASFDLILLPK